MSIRRILNRLPKHNAASVRKRFESGGLLTEKGFSAVVESIRQLAPQASTLLERFSQVRTERIQRLSFKARDNLAQQKEAVLTALSIAGIDRNTVQGWTPSDDTPVSFLEGLPSVRLREDPMVVNDLQRLPGFEVIKTYPYGAAVFESEATSSASRSSPTAFRWKSKLAPTLSTSTKPTRALSWFSTRQWSVRSGEAACRCISTGCLTHS